MAFEQPPPHDGELGCSAACNCPEPTVHLAPPNGTRRSDCRRQWRRGRAGVGLPSLAQPGSRAAPAARQETLEAEILKEALEHATGQPQTSLPSDEGDEGHGLLLDRHAGGAERWQDGRIAVDDRNRRWCSDGFETGCDNGDKVRIAFALDCCDREAMSFLATTSGIRGEDMRDLMVAPSNIGSVGSIACRSPPPD